MKRKPAGAALRVGTLNVHRFADATGDGVVTLDDLRRFVVEERDGVFSDFEDALRVV